MKEHLGNTESVAAGLRALPTTKMAFASTQAAWRFYKNPNVTLKKLAEPLIANGQEAVTQSCQQYVLVVHDWSHLNYQKHNSKQDRIDISNREEMGYELQTALLVSDLDGSPLTSVYQQLRASAGVYSSRSDRILSDRGHLDAIAPTMKFVDSLELGKQTVNIIDREADSVLHYRKWDSQKRKFLIRADETRRVVHDGKSKLLTEIVAERTQLKAFKFSQQVEFKGKLVDQYIAQTTVILNRPARQHRKKNGVESWTNVSGKAIKLRLIISQLCNAEGEILAQWLLFTNLAETVSAEQIALWYYWRWRIESFFKLLKSEGHHLEEWQQETAQAIAKRLLVATMACVVVWQIARSQKPEAAQVRQLLVRLSGRQMKRSKPYTEPALLAGFWVLLSMLELLENHDVEDLKRLIQITLPGFLKPNSS